MFGGWGGGLLGFRFKDWLKLCLTLTAESAVLPQDSKSFSTYKLMIGLMIWASARTVTNFCHLLVLKAETLRHVDLGKLWFTNLLIVFRFVPIFVASNDLLKLSASHFNLSPFCPRGYLALNHCTLLSDDVKELSASLVFLHQLSKEVTCLTQFPYLPYYPFRKIRIRSSWGSDAM